MNGLRKGKTQPIHLSVSGLGFFQNGSGLAASHCKAAQRREALLSDESVQGGADWLNSEALGI